MENRPTKVLTGKVRFSYVSVFEAKLAPGATKPKFSLQLLIDKNDSFTINRCKAAIAAAIEEGKTKIWGGKKPANLKLPLRDGDDEKPELEEYEGMLFLNCSSGNKPGVVDFTMEEIYDSTELYSGCYGRVTINFYPFATQGHKGIAVGLNNVQKLDDGEPLGGGKTNPIDDFKDEIPGRKPVKKKKVEYEDDDDISF